MQFIMKYFRNFIRYRELSSLLVRNNIKLKYRRSFLGYIWTILNPLMTMIILTIVFSQMFQRSIPNYPVYLICGNVLFSFMREATTHSMMSIINNAALIKKVYVPKYIFTYTTITSDFINLLLSFGALVIVMIATKTPVSLYTFLLIIPVVELYVFVLGVGLFLAQAVVFFRDIYHIWRVVVMAWMYLTPLFYDVSMLPANVAFFIKNFNPMYIYITQFRDFVMLSQMTDVKLIVVGALISLLSLTIGLLAFGRAKDRFILYI